MSYEDGMSISTLPFPSYSGWSPVRQTDEDLKACSKTVIISVFARKLRDLTNSRGSYPLADMMALGNTREGTQPLHQIDLP